MESPELSTHRGHGTQLNQRFGDSYRVSRIAVLAGFLATTVAIFVAQDVPATGYEVSIYWSTPLLYWVLIAIAVGIAMLVSFQAHETDVGSFAQVLGGVSVLTVLSLPLIRGYHFFGLADPLNHLGFARELAVGLRTYFEFLYPGGHSTAVLFSTLSGIGIPQAMMLVTVTCILLFLIFVPLTVREIIPDSRAVVLATFSGLMLMPLNNIGTIRGFHTFSLAVLFTPLVLYLMVKHVLRRAEDATLPAQLSAASFLIPLVGLALFLYHPQLAFNVIVIFVVLAGLQVVFRRTGRDHPITHTRAVYGQAIVLATSSYLWTSNHWQASETLRRSKQNLIEYLLGGAEVAPNVKSRQQSAQEAGTSLLELFLKLMTVELLFGIVVGLLVAAKVLGRVDLRPGSDVALTAFVVSGLVLLPYFFVQFIGDVAHHFFRHVGFSMILVTILAPIAFLRFWRRFDGSQFAKSLLIVFIAFSLVLSVVALYPSPFIYRHNSHLSEQHIDGFESAFAHQPVTEPKPVMFRTTGLVVSRYEMGLVARPGTPWYPGRVDPEPAISEFVPESALRRSVVDHIASGYWRHRIDTYISISRVDRKRAIEAENELSYTAGSFERIKSQRDVHRVHTNGQFSTYYADLPPPAGVLYNVTAEQRAEAGE